VQINAICPKCQNRYQFSSTLIGQRIRCQNPHCREVFEVREAPVEKYTPTVKPKEKRDRRAPSFEDAPAPKPAVEPTPVEPVAAGPKVADWSAAPPPVRRRDEPAVASGGAPAAPGAAGADEVLAWMMGGSGAVRQVPAGDGAAEVVFTPAAAGEVQQGAAVAPALAEPSYPLYPEYHAKRSKLPQLIIIALIVLVALGGTGFFLFSQQRKARREGELRSEAATELKEKRFQSSALKYDDLAKNYAKSSEAPQYRFLRDYSQALTAAYEGKDPPAKRRKDLSEFLTKARENDAQKGWLDDPSNQRITWDALRRLADDQAGDVKRNIAEKKFEEAIASYDELRAGIGLLKQNAPKDEKDQVPAALLAEAEQLNETIAAERKFVEFEKRADELLKAPSPASVGLVEDDARRLGYSHRSSIVEKLERAKLEIRKRISFTAEVRPAEPLPAGDGLASLMIGGAGGSGVADGKAVFALSRGVLFALSDADGHTLWATRVGIDAATLPVRIPAVGRAIPELVLVPTTDNRGLIAREAATGKARWFQRLPAPSRGRPILVERRLYIPLADDEGTVALVEANDGQQVGRIKLGQRLGPGGTWQEGTTRIFLPADSQNVFVLDTNPQADADGTLQQLSLSAMLVTGHGAGTLRGEPVVVGGDDPAGGANNEGYLILCQSDGLEAMRIRAYKFRTPIVAVEPPVDVQIRGWSWFPPVCDQEKLALVTDAGSFALIGVNQKGNTDPALFPLLVSPPPAGKPLGRGQIVHMEEQAFWYLANGELNMLLMGIDRKAGMKLAPGWREPRKVGTPLHAGQMSADRKTLFVVTQTTSPPAWLATAVDTQTGNIKWQRPLGLAPQGDPVRLGDFVYQLDQGGGLYQIDPKEVNVQPGVEWYQGGHMVLAARQDLVGAPSLLPAADGKSAYVVFGVGDGRQLQVRQVVPGSPVTELPAASLPAAPAGVPLLVGKTLVLPLANGSLYRVNIGAKGGEAGPDWRAPGLGEAAVGWVVFLGGDTVLVTDGNRGISAYSWPAGQAYQLKFQQTMSDRITRAPLVIRSGDGVARVLIPDAGGRITLLDGDPPAATMRWEVRTMRLGNDVTAGPFLMEGSDPASPRILAVVDQTSLLCLSLDNRNPVWRSKLKGDGLAGTPRRIGNVLILPDSSGRFEAVDAGSGVAAGASFPATGTLPAAPAGGAVEFGPGRLFGPLTDGTVLLVPLDALVSQGKNP
jgi:outer membrane protein assembly factor BamB